MASRRHLLLTVALLATLAATAWLAGNEPPDGDPKAPRAGGDRREARPRPAAETAVRVPDSQALQREPFAGESANLFAAHSWQPPPPPPLSVPAPAPTAPPLPFRFLGQMIEGDKTVVFLASGNRTLLVRAGDTLDGTYQVESVGPTAVAFLYRPLNERQLLSYGRMN